MNLPEHLYIGTNEYIVKRITLIIITVLYISNCFGQDTLERKNKIAQNITEVYHVIKGKENIKEGLYQALYRKKIALASGAYKNDKKIGIWHFYDTRGRLLQTCDYNLNRILYEAREDTSSSLRYLIDKKISDTDKVTKPIKAGGRYFGYLPYLTTYKATFDPQYYVNSQFIGIVELLISPMGRLADYKVRMVSGWYGYDLTTRLDLKFFKEEDKTFIPATYNGVPVQCRIIITCRLAINGSLEFFR